MITSLTTCKSSFLRSKTLSSMLHAPILRRAVRHSRRSLRHRLHQQRRLPRPHLCRQRMYCFVFVAYSTNRFTTQIVEFHRPHRHWQRHRQRSNQRRPTHSTSMPHQAPIVLITLLPVDLAAAALVCVRSLPLPRLQHWLPLASTLLCALALTPKLLCHNTMAPLLRM